jgi:hypothetical protein
MIENSRRPVTIRRAARTPEGSLSQPLQASFILCLARPPLIEISAGGCHGVSIGLSSDWSNNLPSTFAILYDFSRTCQAF